ACRRSSLQATDGAGNIERSRRAAKRRGAARNMSSERAICAACCGVRSEEAVLIMSSDLPERTREYRNHHLDSTRWDGFVPRDDDIVVTTAYKAGTTWTQRILAALVFGPGRIEHLSGVSPWIDARFQGPVEPILGLLESQRHRRFVKSHLAADGLPYFPQVKYLVVGRDTRDVFMSLWNHYSSYTDLTYSFLNDPSRPGREFPRCPATPRELWPRW